MESSELTIRQPEVLLPTLGIKNFMEQIDEIRQLIGKAMRPNIDYGAIPGTDQNKKVLLQPGAQKALMYFNCFPEHAITYLELPGGHLEVRVMTSIIRRSDKEKVAEGIGSCSTMESKYRWRNAERICPEPKCGKPAIIKGNPKYAPKDDNDERLPGYENGGWLCWKKKGGCGKAFEDDDPAITKQTVGKVENENLADVRNTVLKIAKKRADVDGAISLSCLGELFTADMEANEDAEPDEGDLSEAQKFSQTSASLTGQFKQRLRAQPMTPDQLAGIYADMKREWRHIGAAGQKELTQIYRSVEQGLPTPAAPAPLSDVAQTSSTGPEPMTPAEEEVVRIREQIEALAAYDGPDFPKRSTDIGANIARACKKIGDDAANQLDDFNVEVYKAWRAKQPQPQPAGKGGKVK